jgi:hypothetical protein
MKLTLTSNMPATENAAFHWRFALCMMEVTQSLLALHDEDIQEAFVLMAVGIKTLAPAFINSTDTEPPEGIDELSAFVAELGRGPRLNEIARFTRINRSTARRKLERLIERGFIICTDGVHYSLAPNLTKRQPEFVQMLSRHWNAYRRLTEHYVNADIIRFEAAEKP